MNDPLPSGTNYVLQSTTATGFLPNTITVTDDFETKTYSGGSGWATDWTEINDDGNSGKGDVKIKKDKGSERLNIKKNTNGIQRDISLLNLLERHGQLRFSPQELRRGRCADGRCRRRLHHYDHHWARQRRYLPEWNVLDSGRFAQCRDDPPFYELGCFQRGVLLRQYRRRRELPRGSHENQCYRRSRSARQRDAGGPRHRRRRFLSRGRQSMTVTFQIIVNSPLNPAITQIVNTASVRSQSNPVPKTADGDRHRRPVHPGYHRVDRRDR